VVILSVRISSFEKSASLGVTGAMIEKSITTSGATSEKSASIGAIGARLIVATVISSNVASAGVLGASVVNVEELILLFTTAPSLLAKRTFIERVRITAKIVVVAFIFMCCLSFDEAKIGWWVRLG